LYELLDNPTTKLIEPPGPWHFIWNWQDKEKVTF
jgi:hypothetical protein